MTIPMNTRAFALSAILALVLLTAITYEVKRLFAFESSIDDVSNTANYQASEIEGLQSVIEDLRSDVENLDTRLMGHIKILRFARKIHAHLFTLISS